LVTKKLELSEREEDKKWDMFKQLAEDHILLQKENWKKEDK
jgi:hypothetical protein